MHRRAVFRRSGGEDFYLLNKIAKLGKIAQLNGDPIQLEPRTSSRVPFGTGPAVDKIMKLDSLSDFTSYDPEVFRDLAQLLRHFKTLWQYRTDSRAWLDRLPERMKTALLSLDIDSLVRHLQSQVHSKAAALTHIERWFDGFRTLKFIHHLQAHSFPQILFTEALLRANDILDNPLEPGDLVLGPNGIQFTKTGTPNRR